MNKRQKAYVLTDGRCFYCGERLNNSFVLDHMIPKVSNGGGSENLVACCRDCNAFKSSLSLEEFRTKIEKLLESDFHGRICKKYYGVRHRKILFYFEKQQFKEGHKNG